MPASPSTSFDAFSNTESVSVTSILVGTKNNIKGNVSLWQKYATHNAGHNGHSGLATPHKSRKGALLSSSLVEVLKELSMWLALSLDVHAQRSLKLIASFQMHSLLTKIHALSTKIPPSSTVCAPLITSSTAYDTLHTLTSEMSIGLSPFSRSPRNTTVSIAGFDDLYQLDFPRYGLRVTPSYN